MKKETLTPILVLIPNLLFLAVLIFAVLNPERFGFMLLGSAVGWMLYYFIRKYRIFSPKSLAASISAILGGEALAWIAHLRGSSIDIELQYFTGLGFGFFLFAIYAGFCSWMYALGVIPSQSKFEIAIGCGAGVGRDLDEIEAVMEFEEKAKQWANGHLEDSQFIDFINGIDISRKKLVSLIEQGEVELEKQLLKRIQESKILPIVEIKC